MSLKYFFKHIFRSMRQKPVQPILLILVMTMSIIVSATAFHIRAYLEEENTVAAQLSNGNADLVVRSSSVSDPRFVFTEDFAEDINSHFPGSQTVGTYAQPMYSEDGDVYFAVGVDLRTVTTVLDVPLRESTVITGIGDAAIVSPQFAQEKSLSLGDTFRVRFFGYNSELTVTGISEQPLLGEYDLMVDVSGIAGKMSVGGVKMNVASTLFINAGDNDLDEMIEYLNEVYPDKAVSTVDKSAGHTALGVMKTIIMLLVLLTVIFSVFVLLSCLSILSKERAADNTLFRAVGARPQVLNALQYFEVTVYWAIACTLSYVAMIPITHFLVRVSGFRFVSAHIIPRFLLFGACITLIAGLLSAFIFIRSAKHPFTRKIRPIPKVFLALPVLTAVLYPLQFVMRISGERFYLSVGLLCAVLIVVYLYTPPLFRRFFRGIRVAPDQKPVLSYSLKNISMVDELSNTCRLFALVLTVLSAAAVIIACGQNFKEQTLATFAGDYLITGTRSDSREKLEANDKIAHVDGVYFIHGRWGGADAYLVSADRDGALGPYAPTGLSELGTQKRIVKGEEVVCYESVASAANAATMGAEIGDVIRFTIGDTVYYFVLTRTIPDNSLYLYCNVSAIESLDYNFISVTGADGVSPDQLNAAITTALADEIATVVMPSKSVLRIATSSIDVYILCGKFIGFCLLLFALIGIFDNLAESYRARRDEFALYEAVGMKRKAVKQMKVTETLLTVASSLLILLIAFGFVFMLLRQGLLCHGIELLTLL